MYYVLDRFGATHPCRWVNKYPYIEGANFRKGVMVEFVKGDSVIRQQLPETMKGDRLTVTLSTRMIDAMGDFRVRVVNPGNVASISFHPQQSDIVAGSEEDD